MVDYIKLGSSDLSVSKLCLGTMTWGQQNTIEEAHAQLDLAIDYGINFLDTAELYPVPMKAETYTRTESYIGEWLKHQDRSKLVVASKIAGPGRGINWIRDGDHHVDDKNLVQALNDSLKRLQTDYLDLYQIHWPERYVPSFGEYFYELNKERPVSATIHQQLESLSKLVESGKIRYIGVSNETPYGVSEFIKLSEQYNLPRIVSIQNAYNLVNRNFEFGLSEMCKYHNVGLLTYSILAFGHLTGKHLDGNSPADSRAVLFPGYAQRYSKINVEPATRAYIKLASEYGLSPVELAVGFVKSRWFVSSVILGATSTAQLSEQLKASEVKLPDDIFPKIDALFAQFGTAAP